mgnify:CR=1 FL=1
MGFIKRGDGKILGIVVSDKINQFGQDEKQEESLEENEVQEKDKKNILNSNIKIKKND